MKVIETESPFVNSRSFRAGDVNFLVLAQIDCLGPCKIYKEIGPRDLLYLTISQCDLDDVEGLKNKILKLIAE